MIKLIQLLLNSYWIYYSNVTDGKIADPVIAIDPGHGGKDPGSIGSDGTDEADLNLKIAKKLILYFPTC
ncbi:N-acetylmuramoyl-L-alanine amidase family protein [Brevibacillus laterosporus]|uniref:N-acetylmuramoyl-L-alanine amidase family protein n=1 Tax=Brevibacillus laterosporus TaxID=1465 RepID=UPI003D2116B7